MKSNYWSGAAMAVLLCSGLGCGTPATAISEGGRDGQTWKRPPEGVHVDPAARPDVLKAGLANADPHAIGVTQRMVYAPMLATAFNAYWVDHHTVPTSPEDLKPFLAAWPLRPDGTPWPIESASTSPANDPTVYLGAGAQPPAFSWRMPVDAADTAANDPLAVCFSKEWREKTGTILASQNYPANPKWEAIAGNLAIVISNYHMLTGHYLETPDAIFAACNMGIVRDAETALRSEFRTIEFYRRPDWMGMGLLLERASGEQILLYQDGRNPRNGSVAPWGYTEGGRAELRKLMAGMVLWQKLEEMVTVPRVDIPAFPAVPATAVVTGPVLSSGTAIQPTQP